MSNNTARNVVIGVGGFTLGELIGGVGVAAAGTAFGVPSVLIGGTIAAAGVAAACVADQFNSDATNSAAKATARRYAYMQEKDLSKPGPMEAYNAQRASEAFQAGDHELGCSYARKANELRLVREAAAPPKCAEDSETEDQEIQDLRSGIF